MANLNVTRFLGSDDLVEIGMMQRVAAKVRELQDFRDDQLAVRIANHVLGGIK